MSRLRPEAESDSSANELRDMVALCRFEAEWESGRRRRAEELVANRPADERAILLPRILALEIELREKSGEQVSFEDIAARFPNNLDLVYDAQRRFANRSADRFEIRTQCSGPVHESDSDSVPALGRYRVTGRVGAGGFGVVYSAYDDELHRMVAIKVPHKRLSSRQEFVDNYLTEARVLASLDHSNIVPLFDVGCTPDGRPFVVSKFIEGNNLSELLARGRPEFTRSTTIVAAIAGVIKGLVFGSFRAPFGIVLPSWRSRVGICKWRWMRAWGSCSDR